MHCGLTLLKPIISIENQPVNEEEKYKEQYNGAKLMVPSAMDLSPILESNSLSRPDNTCTDQLIDLVPDDGVLHVILEGGGVGLSLLQNRLHDWVAHNLLHRTLLIKSPGEMGLGGGERTATSGSRMARCMTSSSDSPSR